VVFVQLLRKGDEEICGYLPVPCSEDYGLTLDEIREIIERDYCCSACKGNIKVRVSFASDEPIRIQVEALKVNGRLVPVYSVSRREGKIKAEWICCTEGTPEKSYDDECFRHWDWQWVFPHKAS